MPPTATPAAAVSPVDPVRAALADPSVREGLLKHALVSLNQWLGHLPWDKRFDMADESAQEASRRALAGSSKFNPNAGTNAAGWVHGFLNLVLMEKNREQKQAVRPAIDLSTLPAADSFDETSPLWELLGQLTAEERNLVEMHHLEGLSHAEIAANLSISPAASRTRLSRAMMKLTRIAQAMKEGN